MSFAQMPPSPISAQPASFHLLFVMLRTLSTRAGLPRVLPRVNLHLSKTKVEETSSSDAQQKAASNTDGEVKFDHVNRTGLIQLNKPKALNALSLSMVRQIYPKMKVRTLALRCSGSAIIRVGMGVRRPNRSGDYQKYESESILCWR